MRASVITVIGLSSALAIGCAGQAAGIRLNQSPSMPIGVWIERGKDSAHVYALGDVVEACPHLTEGQQVYLGPGDCPSRLEPMLKPIAAVVGDIVSVGPSGVTVNGIPVPNSVPLPHDSQDRTLPPYLAGTYTVTFGHVWLLVPRVDSLDSRYLGPVPISDIRRLVAPVWVWR